VFCCWVEDEKMCGRQAELVYHIPLCQVHRNVTAVTNQMRCASNAVKVMDCDRSASVYFLSLPTGNIKIGVSSKLPDRLKSLHRQFGGRVELLASTVGGFEVEARLHHRFSEFRVTDLMGEQFIPNPELDELICDTGLDFMGRQALTVYERYEPRTMTPNPAYVYDLAA
jgi:hypothetical protein